MDFTHILTGYNDAALSTIDSADTDSGSENKMSKLMDKYIDRRKYTYNDNNAEPDSGSLLAKSSQSQAGAVGLHQSKLLGQLPWFTSLRDIFESTPEFIKVRHFAMNRMACYTNVWIGHYGGPARGVCPIFSG